jgi:hypothetical protein
MIEGPEAASLAGRASTNIYLEGRLPLLEASVARALGLRDGQVVHAKAQAHPGGWALQLPGHTLELPEAPASWRLSAGDTLLFRVQLQADGSVLLRPLPQPDSSPLQPGPALLPDRSAQLLHRPPGTAALGELMQPATLDQLLQNVRRLAPELAPGLQAWMQQRPNMAQLTPARLQQMLLQGGWMTEALLAQGRMGDLLDFKSSLRGLLRQLSARGSETQGLLQDALDEIEARQLQASESSNTREWAISLMLPFADAPPVQVKLAWQRPEGEGERRFTVQLHTASPQLGDLWLQSQITGLSRVDLVMWAEREDIARKAQARSASLAEELDSAGLQLVRMQVVHGRRPVEPRDGWVPPEHGSMVDVAT